MCVVIAQVQVVMGIAWNIVLHSNGMQVHGIAQTGMVLTVSVLRKAQIICFQQAFQLNPSAIVVDFPSSHKGHVLQVAMCNLSTQTQRGHPGCLLYHGQPEMHA